MIDRLRIQNFKCWKDTGDIELAPITLFFGANSSGKSSIGQFLMMLKQSIEYSDRKTVFFTGDQNSDVDLGLPSNLIYDKNNDRHIMFSYDWIPAMPLEIEDAVHTLRRSVRGIHFESDVHLIEGTQNLEVDKIRYDFEIRDGGNIDFSLQKKKGNKVKKGYELLSSSYNFRRKQGRAWDITSPIRFYGFPDEAIAYYQNADFLSNINLSHEKLFSDVYYLGPLRSRAKRLYTWLGGFPKDVGANGEDAISAILSARESGRTINYRERARRRPLEVLIAEMLKKMGLVQSFEIKKISDLRQDYEVKVQTPGDKNFVDIPDVGVGVSQVLPVVVELFYAPPGSTIIMEQPELHLHPSAQALLADVMIDAIHAKENFERRNIQMIIESHSEHFLRRFQRRIAEETLRRDEFSAYFVDYRRSANLNRLVVDEYGDIKNWPENFFGDIQGDIFSQAMAGVDRRKKQ